MKNSMSFSIISALFLCSGFLVFFSCKKENQPPANQPPVIQPPANQPPVARAGEAQSIFLPIDSVTLSGEASDDPDGSILSYSWKQIDGPNESVMTNRNVADVKATGLVKGTYQFRLQVADNSGATGADNVTVIVNQPPPIPVINTELISVGSLSEWRQGMAAVSAGNKILFAGGSTVFGGPTTRVDIYDVAANTWSIAELSQARYNIAAASAGNKIVFAGGETATGITARVDIYDVVANSWTTAELSEARQNIAAGSAGTKILFAGGSNGNSESAGVDIYDVATNSWSTAGLGHARESIAAGSLGNKIFFAGGAVNYTWDYGDEASNWIDIYDASQNTWSTATLSEAKIVSGVTTVGNTIIFAGLLFGGINYTSYTDPKLVDTYDTAAGNWSVDSLNRYDFLSPVNEVYCSGAATSGNFAVFISNSSSIDRFVIYDAAQRQWAISSELPPLAPEDVCVTANNKIYIASRDVSGVEGVWRVQF